jgi:hypothetical protein
MNRATAAETPSSEVPLITPTTTDASADRPQSRRRHLGVGREQLHGDRQLHLAARRREQRPRGFTREAAHLHHDPLGAIGELGVGRAQVDHQVAVALADADHRTGGDHVEHLLGGGPRLQARRSGEHLGADDGHDAQVGDLSHRLRRRRAGDQPRRGPEGPRAGERGAHEGRRPGSRDADHDVARGDAVRVHRGSASALVVLRALDRRPQRGVPAGDDADHLRGIGAEGGRALAGVEDPEPPRGAGADVEQPVAVAQRVLDERDRLRDRRALRRHRIGDRPVFGADEVDDLVRRREVDVDGPGVATFGDAGIERRHGEAAGGSGPGARPDRALTLNLTCASRKLHIDSERAAPRS